MSILASDVLKRARDIWKDPDNATYSATNALQWLNDAVQEVVARRGDAQLDENGALNDYADVVATTDVIALHIKYRSLLADFVAARGFMEDGDSQGHLERAYKHFQQFYEALASI
jgi:hypothetical protein